MKTINAFITDNLPITKHFETVIKPQLAQNMPVLEKHTLSLLEQNYPQCQFVSLDWRHWYYNDTIFEQYIDKVAISKPEYLFVFDNPYDHERPWKIDIKTFAKKLSQRTHIIKEATPNTKLISPLISVIYYDFRPHYYNYLAKHSNLFDYYSVLCSNDMTDTSIGAISSTLKELNNKNRKETFLLTAIPCLDKMEKNIKRSTIADFVPFNEKDAVFKIKQLFNVFNSITNIYMLYFGIGKDLFHPETLPSSMDFWGDHTLPLDAYILEDRWQWIHFLGLVDHSDRVKVQLMKGLIDFANERN